MAKIVSIHSYRGGTGKSNITANLAWWLASRGKRVAVLDTDLQSPGVHMVFGFDSERMTFSLSDFFFDKCDIEETAYDLSRDLGLSSSNESDNGGRLWLLPSSMTVEAITRILSDGYDVTRLHDKLRDLLTALKLDFLLLDTHPGLNRETMLTTAVSDGLLLLLRPDTQDYHGTAVVLEVAKRLGVPQTFLVANKVASSLDPANLRKSVEDAFGFPLIGLLPLAEEVATLGSRGLFCRELAGHAVALEVDKIGEHLLASFDGRASKSDGAGSENVNQ